MTATRDERLAHALQDVLRRQAAGEVVDLDAQEPDLVDELRQLLAVGQVLDFARAPDPHRTAPASDAPAPDLPRTLGDYELLKELGRGGMGVVYKAWDRRLKRFVALKMILRGRSASHADLGRFQSEAQAAAGLAHPNIVPVYEVGEVEGQAYFSMKYVPGQSLAELVAAGPLPQRQAAAYVAAVARAVQHAHERGILHRDLKPANVLLDENDQPLVTDFGLAKRVEGDPSLTGTGAILGTPSYMAPEQTQPDARAPGPAADVYSLGAVLYQLLTGRPPFLAASAVETLLLVRSEEPVRPGLLNPQLDPDLELICRKCLEKRPEHRYTSADALADDLEAYLAGEPVSARSGSLVDFLSRLLRETHHAPVLEHWGLLWIWHSLALLGLCVCTAGLYTIDVHELVYPLLWAIGLIVWGAIFWNLRKRGGPVTFVERQIAHAWGAGVTASIGMFIVERALGLAVLQLSPVLAIVAGMVFLVMAGTLSGWFYVFAALEFACALVMAWLGPAWGLVLFGVVSGLGFFVPGLKYYRQRLRGKQR